MIPLAWQLGIVAALAVGSWFHGRSVGADSVQAKWDQAEIARDKAIQAQEAVNRRQASLSSEQYEATKARLRKAEQAKQELQDALNKPACQGDKDESLADLPIPSAAVDRLRRAAGSSESGTPSR